MVVKSPNWPLPYGARGFGGAGYQLVALVHREGAVGSKALHREGPRDANLGLVLKRLVVEVLVIGPAGDGGVYRESAAGGSGQRRRPTASGSWALCSRMA